MTTIYRAFVLAVLVAMTACGGGDYDPEEDKKTIDPPNCQVTPSLCR